MNSVFTGRSEKTYLKPALFVSTFVFFPVGIFAVKYSLDAKKLYSEGRILEARAAANTSKKIIFFSLVIAGILYTFGALGGLIYLIFH